MSSHYQNQWWLKNSKPLPWGWYSPSKLGQYNACWCPDSSRHQVISSHDTDCVENTYFRIAFLQDNFQQPAPFACWGRYKTQTHILISLNNSTLKGIIHSHNKGLAPPGLPEDHSHQTSLVLPYHQMAEWHEGHCKVETRDMWMHKLIGFEQKGN